ncbi:MAG TPA: VWA domain-containing protein [Vicinamibacterales bacterium]|nr:VWA domain-containing protein [Vicinamibacterales bacterium]
MKCPLLILSLAAACVLPSMTSAQAKPTEVYVSVLDNKGEPALGLTAADFRVREDGTAREVLKAAPATEPLTVAFLVDDSQAASAGIQMIREGVESFIKGLAGKAEVTLVTFGERPTIAVEYTTDQKKLLDGAHRIFPRSGSGAYLMDAIVEVSKGLQKRKAARPVIAILTLDNNVEFSNRHYENVLGELDKSGAALHVVALGQPSSKLNDEMRNRNQVVALGTERTGGRRDNVLALTAAGPRMAQLAAELVNQYVVTYSRPETLIPPEKIAVTVTKPGLTARARTHTGQVGAR